MFSLCAQVVGKLEKLVQGHHFQVFGLCQLLINRPKLCKKTRPALHIDPFYGSGESLIYCPTSSAAPELRSVNEPVVTLVDSRPKPTAGQVPKVPGV